MAILFEFDLHLPQGLTPDLESKLAQVATTTDISHFSGYDNRHVVLKPGTNLSTHNLSDPKKTGAERHVILKGTDSHGETVELRVSTTYDLLGLKGIQVR